MTTWTNDAQKRLEAYLNQVKALLQGQAVDAGEVVDDLRNHVTNLSEGSGNTLITEPDLQRILATLGSPEEVAHSWSGNERAVPSVEPDRSAPQMRSAIRYDRSSTTKWVAFPILIGVLVTAGIAFTLWKQHTEKTPDSKPASLPSDPLYLAGDWQSVDFVKQVEDFKPGVKTSPGDLFLKELHCFENGDSSLPVMWKDGWITDKQSQFRAQYEVKTLDGEVYLFLPWISGDVTIRGQKPKYYVLKRVVEDAPKNLGAAPKPSVPHPANSAPSTAPTPVGVVAEFNDVRGKNLRNENMTGRWPLTASLIFNEDTQWPDTKAAPSDYSPKNLLENAKNPGLGVRELHSQGITGKGVNVAIIDQPLFQEHPEYAGKITAFRDFDCGTPSSMHGPAVASLLVGTRCGTAPESKLYYAATPSWKKDSAYYAQALDWIIAENAKLPANEKIRVVSVSAAPSGKPSPFEKNQAQWDAACQRAEGAGILVLDCTQHRGLINRCYYDPADPEDPAKCRPGAPDGPYSKEPKRLSVPSSFRTTAEAQEHRSGVYGYIYWGHGGLSWSIPYCAGVLAMGWQVRPELSNQKMIELLFQSAYVDPSGAKIIRPIEFIRLVKAS